MKKKQVDINNLADNKRQKDHLYSDILGQGGHSRDCASPNKKATTDNNAPNKSAPSGAPPTRKDKKYDNLKSSLDTHEYDPAHKCDHHHAEGKEDHSNVQNQAMIGKPS